MLPCRAGLLGSNWLYLLDMARKNVLQAGAPVIPAAATLYCCGIQARTTSVAGSDFSSFDKHRCAHTSFCPLSPSLHAAHALKSTLHAALRSRVRLGAICYCKVGQGLCGLLPGGPAAPCAHPPRKGVRVLLRRPAQGPRPREHPGPGGAMALLPGIVARNCLVTLVTTASIGLLGAACAHR